MVTLLLKHPKNFPQRLIRKSLNQTSISQLQSSPTNLNQPTHQHHGYHSSTTEPQPKKAASEKNSRSKDLRGKAGYDYSYYPTIESEKIIDPTNNSKSDPSSFIIDPDYIQRYRDPSSHDNYKVINHNHPYQFRTRPTETQKVPDRFKNTTTDNDRTSDARTRTSKRSPPNSFDPSFTSFEARQARIEMERSWLSQQQTQPQQPPTSPKLSEREPLLGPLSLNKIPQIRKESKVSICFPGTGSQYIGMGSFLSDSNEFKRTWEEAEQSLVEFEDWRRSLDLVDRFRSLGYDEEDAEVLGGPMRRGAMMSSSAEGDDELGSRGLKHVVFNGPQNELTRSSNAQPAILITSIAYLRALEIDCQVPIRSRTVAYAGHSSGEFTACVASGMIDFSSTIKLTRLLGLLSTRTSRLRSIEPYTNLRAPNESRGQMSAILIDRNTLSNNPHSIEEVYRVIGSMNLNLKIPVEIGSVNSSSQIVLSGTRAGILAVCERLHELEIANRAADLPCSSPFHNSFMRPVSEGLRIGLGSIKGFRRPSKPMIYSTSGHKVLEEPKTFTLKPSSSSLSSGLIKEDKSFEKEEDEDEELRMFREHLIDSIRKPVWWSRTMNELLRRSMIVKDEKVFDRSVDEEEERIESIIFIGPGRALNNLCKKEINLLESSSSSSSDLNRDFLKKEKKNFEGGKVEDYENRKKRVENLMMGFDYGYGSVKLRSLATPEEFRVMKEEIF